MNRITSKSTRDYFDRITGGWDKGTDTDDPCRWLTSLVARFGIPHGGRIVIAHLMIELLQHKREGK